MPRAHLVAWAALCALLLFRCCEAACPSWDSVEKWLKNEPSIPDTIDYENFGLAPHIVELPDGKMFLPTASASDTVLPRDRRPRRVVINYARNCCEVSQHRNCMSALRWGADVCFAYNESALSPAFQRRNKDILSLPRGGGYWIWKPYIIMRTLMRLDDGDLVMYSDAAQDFVDDLGPLFDDALGEQPVVLGEAQWFELRNWVKRDAFLLLGCLDEQLCTRSHHLQASLFVFRKAEAALALVAKWLAYMQDPRASTDMPNVLGLPDYEAETWHRHDQSIISLIAVMQKLRTLKAYHDNIPKLEFNCTVYHHRIRR